MKYIVIAHHHGALLTIKQLCEWNLDFIVLVPQSQLDKYGAMQDEIFINFFANVKKTAGKNPVHVFDQTANPVVAVHAEMEKLKLSGQWMVLQAGSLLLAYGADLDMKSRFGLVKQRVHPKFKRLYTLLGEPEESKHFYPSVFFIDMSKKDLRVSEVDSNLIMRPDVLYSRSFGALWCVRHRQMVNESWAANFWMEVIREDQSAGEWVGYPYHLYAEYAKKVKKMLPPVSFENILENAKSAEWVQDLVALDL